MDMFSDVSDLQKARGNLILASVAVILFVHGKGSFNAGSFGLGLINFEEKLALPIAGCCIFYFIVWRFLLSSSDSLRTFFWDFNKYVYSNDTYKKVLNEWLKYNRVDHNEFLKNSIFFERDSGRVGYIPPKIMYGPFPTSLCYFGHVTDAPFNKPYLPVISQKDPKEIRGSVGIVNSLKLTGLCINSFFKSIFFRRGFTDVVFPFLIGYYAVIILSVKITNFLWRYHQVC